MVMGALFQNEGLCRTSSSIQNFRGRKFYLSPAGSGMIPFLISNGLRYPDLVKAVSDAVIRKEIFGSGFDMHVFVVSDGSIVLVEHINPWRFITFKRAITIVAGAYSLGFRRLQGFQFTLPDLSMEGVSPIRGDLL